jgi:hypothetical protein
MWILLIRIRFPWIKELSIDSSVDFLTISYRGENYCRLSQALTQGMDELPVVDCLQRVLLVVHNGISKILGKKIIKQVSVC